VKRKLFTKTGVDSSCTSCLKTITSECERGLRCDDCNNAFHEKCIPKYHKEHIPFSEDGDEFLCYKVKPSESNRPSNEKWEEEERDDNDNDNDDDMDELFSLANKQK
jgi:hypothetical protein